MEGRHLWFALMKMCLMCPDSVVTMSDFHESGPITVQSQRKELLHQPDKLIMSRSHNICAKFVGLLLFFDEFWAVFFFFLTFYRLNGDVINRENDSLVLHHIITYALLTQYQYFIFSFHGYCNTLMS